MNGLLIAITLLAPATQPVSPATRPTERAAPQRAAASPVESGKRQITPVSELIRLFPDSKHHFSYLRHPQHTPRWNSRVTMFDRYELVMQADVEMDVDRTRVLGWKNLLI